MSRWNKRQSGDRKGCRPARSRPTWGRFQEYCTPALRPRPCLDSSWRTNADWPDFWDAAQRELRSVGVRTGTLRVYRHVLRHFRTFLSAHGAGARPGGATPALARDFLYQLSNRQASWSWTATHITAIRTVFDKLGGASLTKGMVTPKRPRRLHDVLEPEEVGRLLEAAGSTRNRLAIFLLYGCGLKTSDLCGLRWSDVDIAGRTVRVRFAGLPASDPMQAGGTRERKVLLPANAIPLLQVESCYRQPGDPVFGTTSKRKAEKPAPSQRNACTKLGSRQHHSISTRTVERIVRHAAVAAGLTAKEVNCRTLRRSYAVQCLRDGMDIESLRINMGHKYVDSTLAYRRYLFPEIAKCGIAGGGADRQEPLPMDAFPPAIQAIQCNAP